MKLKVGHIVRHKTTNNLYVVEYEQYDIDKYVWVLPLDINGNNGCISLTFEYDVVGMITTDTAGHIVDYRSTKGREVT